MKYLSTLLTERGDTDRQTYSELYFSVSLIKGAPVCAECTTDLSQDKHLLQISLALILSALNVGCSLVPRVIMSDVVLRFSRS